MKLPDNYSPPYIVNAYVNSDPVAVHMTVYVLRRKRGKKWGNPEVRRHP